MRHKTLRARARLSATRTRDSCFSSNDARSCRIFSLPLKNMSISGYFTSSKEYRNRFFLRERDMFFEITVSNAFVVLFRG